MPKLHLKRTPEEEAAHQLRKKQKKESKRRRRNDDAGSSSRKRYRTDDDPTHTRKWDSSDDDIEYGPQPASHASSSRTHTNGHTHKPDYDAILAELEEQRFREKMSGAFEDDERLDSLEARMNDFAHVPGRWRDAGAGRPGRAVYEDLEDDSIMKLDPRYMDEEEYAEWIRAGMYRKTHAEEFAEQQRKKAEKAARRAEEKARKAETARLEKAAEEEWKQRELERESRRWDYAREEYDRQWKELLGGGKDGDGDSAGFSFGGIPWPVVAAYSRNKRGSKSTPVSLDELTVEEISKFLLAGVEEKKERRDKLRETFLRFHPDKFEGRVMRLVREDERAKVGEGIGQVVRALNTLIA